MPSISVSANKIALEEPYAALQCLLKKQIQHDMDSSGYIIVLYLQRSTGMANKVISTESEDLILKFVSPSPYSRSHQQEGSDVREYGAGNEMGSILDATILVHEDSMDREEEDPGFMTDDDD